MKEFLIPIIALIVIVAIIIILDKKFIPSKADKQKARDFLVSLKDTIHAVMLKAISEFNFSTYTGTDDIEIDMIGDIFIAIKDCIEIEAYNTKNDLKPLVIKALESPLLIDDFIMTMIDEYKIKDVIYDTVNNYIQSKNIEIESEDKKLEEQFSSDDYNEEEMEVLPEAVKEEVPEEELKKLNPPSDEEEAYNANDSSMELVNEDIFYDKNGRARSKTTGKYVKLN